MKRHPWIYALVFTLCSIGTYADQNEVGIFQENRNPWSERSYLGSIDVSIETSKGMKVHIETDDLILQSVNWDHFENYVDLMGDSETMKKFSIGSPWPVEQVIKRMTNWINRWENQNDPFSAFAIFSKAAGYPFVGHIILGYGNHDAESELAYIIKPQFQHCGYGKQATTALLYGLAPRLIQDQFLVNKNDDDCHPAVLNIIHATARIDNPYSIRILERIGMHPGIVEEQNGALRIHYSITAEELLHNKALRDMYLIENSNQ